MPNKGTFKPRNPEKYVGNITNITFRSGWEKSFMQWLDNNTMVIKWASEEIAIPYIKPTDQRMHKYYPDFFMQWIDANGEIRGALIEIKPHKETSIGNSESQRDLEAALINSAKWDAAKAFCVSKGIEWMVLTEHQLFPKKGKIK